MRDGRPQRQQKRTRLGGTVRLLVDTPDGLTSTDGQIIDLSEGGCALRLHRPIDAHLPGRVHVVVARQAIWLPIITRWARADFRAWTVGCQFDRPTPEKQQAIRTMLCERRRLTV
jgi:hypothetical protein